MRNCGPAPPRRDEMSLRESQPTQRSSVTAISPPSGVSSASYSGRPLLPMVRPRAPSSTLTNAFWGYVPIGSSAHVADPTRAARSAAAMTPKCWSAFETSVWMPDGKCTRRRWSSAAFEDRRATSMRGDAVGQRDVGDDALVPVIDAPREARSAARPAGSRYVISIESVGAGAARRRGCSAARRARRRSCPISGTQ